MSTFDVYGRTDALPPPVLDAIVARLEARGKHPAFRRMLDEYLEAMAIDSARTVLDLGCGTGVAARAIARRPGFAGTVVGLDLSPYLVAAAQRLAEAEGGGDRIAFRVGDTCRLDLTDGAVDAVVAHTLISHVDDPGAVLAEARRVVKPGGPVGLFDGDYASLTFSHEDPVRGKAYDEAIQRAVITNPRVMRQLPRLLRAAGLDLVRAFAYVVADIGTADFFAPAIESFRKLLPQSGVMAEADVNTWADARLNESAEGTFFGASNFYAYVAKRPCPDPAHRDPQPRRRLGRPQPPQRKGPLPTGNRESQPPTGTSASRAPNAAEAGTGPTPASSNNVTGSPCMVRVETRSRQPPAASTSSTARRAPSLETPSARSARTKTAAP